MERLCDKYYKRSFSLVRLIFFDVLYQPSHLLRVLYSNVLRLITPHFNLTSNSLPTMPSPFNTAAWLTAARATPLEIKAAPYTPPGENEILIKNGAVAINPVDWAIQARGNALFSWLQYPTFSERTWLEKWSK